MPNRVDAWGRRRLLHFTFAPLCPLGTTPQKGASAPPCHRGLCVSHLIFPICTRIFLTYSFVGLVLPLSARQKARGLPCTFAHRVWAHPVFAHRVDGVPWRRLSWRSCC